MLPYIISLDLSSNNLSGEIPPDFGNCSFLNILKLDNNRLTGQIPPEIGLLSRIKYFSVANNRLEGPVPQFLGNTTISVDSYANNLGLCGNPLNDCKAAPKSKNEYRDFFISGFAVGYAPATILVLELSLFGLPSFLMTKKKKKTEQEVAATQSQGYESSPTIEDGKISTLAKFVTKVSFTELLDATHNFHQDNVIGVGMKGLMYKAMLPNGCCLAIKRLHDSRHLDEQFVAETVTLGSHRHHNLVPLLGFCFEMEERLLVYKYMPNGNLQDWLHSTDGQAKTLDWPSRAKIAVGVARGLAWLHHSCNFQIVHCNISSKCILLDKNFEPKISNFGEAKITNPNDTLSSWSFLANGEFWELGYNKKDVYSFGIVLLELITGKQPSRVTNSSETFDGTLVDWITNLGIISGVYDAVDKSLNGLGFDDEIFQFLRVACDCIQPFPNQRPTMLQVYERMRVIKARYSFIDDSEISTEDNSDFHCFGNIDDYGPFGTR